MYHAAMATISAEQTRNIRDQVTASRRAREARRVVQARPAGPFALVARALTRQKRQGPATA